MYSRLRLAVSPESSAARTAIVDSCSNVRPVAATELTLMIKQMKQARNLNALRNCGNAELRDFVISQFRNLAISHFDFLWLIARIVSPEPRCARLVAMSE